MAQRLLDMLQEVYDSEINFAFSCFWDGGWEVRLGDDMNGWKEMWEDRSLARALWLLPNTVCKHYPESDFAKRRIGAEVTA